jgi:tetratricopeptide (TPR) repeat protein
MKSPAWTASAERGAQLHRAGKLPAAARAYASAITLAERAGDARGLADARCGLGWVYLAQNKPHDGYRCFLIASTTPGLSPDSAELCAAVIGLGDAEHARMAFAAAIPHYERAIGVLVANNAHTALAGVHASLGMCLAMLNRLDDADRHADIARSLARFTEEPKLEAKAEAVLEIVRRVRPLS